MKTRKWISWLLVVAMIISHTNLKLKIDTNSARDFGARQGGRPQHSLVDCKGGQRSIAPKEPG